MENSDLLALLENPLFVVVVALVLSIGLLSRLEKLFKDWLPDKSEAKAPAAFTIDTYALIDLTTRVVDLEDKVEDLRKELDGNVRITRSLRQHAGGRLRTRSGYNGRHIQRKKGSAVLGLSSGRHSRGVRSP